MDETALRENLAPECAEDRQGSQSYAEGIKSKIQKEDPKDKLVDQKRYGTILQRKQLLSFGLKI